MIFLLVTFLPFMDHSSIQSVAHSPNHFLTPSSWLEWGLTSFTQNFNYCCFVKLERFVYFIFSLKFIPVTQYLVETF